jgi:RNA polymerase sigma factor (sigma-70 family)
VNGDAHLAQDITQTVFVNLARKAHTLPTEIVLGWWLHRVTCFVAGTTMRGERRRQFRERQAVAMNTPEDHMPDNLAMLTPILDEAINQLGPDDRIAILLRFFDQLEFRAVAEKMGSNEDAARMRVTRALDKLQVLLKNRGVTFSAAALSAALAVGFVSAAPIGLAATVAGTAFANATTGGVTATLLKYITMTKLKIAVVSTIAVAALATPLWMQHQSLAKLREENQSLRLQATQLARLQTENQRLSDLAAQANAKQAPAEQQARDLARLRNEVAQLRDQTNELVRVRQQIQTLSQHAASGIAPVSGAVVAIPSGVFPDANQTANICLNNLRLIQEAKQKWALDNHKQNGDMPTMEDLRPYFGQGPDKAQPSGIHGVLPNGVIVEELAVCPGHGVYKVGAIGENPTCSVPGHVLP